VRFFCLYVKIGRIPYDILPSFAHFGSRKHDQFAHSVITRNLYLTPMANLVSYRKYRPLKFGQVLNQEHVKVTLGNAVVNGRVGHAYLFTGPRGVGKTTIARILARSINCLVPKDGEPCNECDICQEFIKNNSLDLLEIDAASHTGVDNIRELIEHVQFAPTRAKFKVIIIDEVHMLSKGAFNALLKTLEEPPKQVVFILETTEIHKVPATIV
jgi:DNA polymerase III subunit gamma/tau